MLIILGSRVRHRRWKNFSGMVVGRCEWIDGAFDYVVQQGGKSPVRVIKEVDLEPLTILKPVLLTKKKPGPASCGLTGPLTARLKSVQAV